MTNNSRLRSILRVLLGIGITIAMIPSLMITHGIGYEIYGYLANHAATDKQTKALEKVIVTEIDGVQIKDVYSETGNTTGTSNHVDCLSRITFSSDKDQDHVSEILKKHYDCNDEDYFTVTIKRENGIYIVTQISQAPYPYNIEGH